MHACPNCPISSRLFQHIHLLFTSLADILLWAFWPELLRTSAQITEFQFLNWKACFRCSLQRSWIFIAQKSQFAVSETRSHWQYSTNDMNWQYSTNDMSCFRDILFSWPFTVGYISAPSAFDLHYHVKRHPGLVKKVDSYEFLTLFFKYKIFWPTACNEEENEIHNFLPPSHQSIILRKRF